MEDEEENNEPPIQRFQNNLGEHFDEILKRAKRQDWWGFSKMLLVVSVGLVLISGMFISGELILNTLVGIDRGIIFSLVSIILAIGSNTIFYIVSIAVLASLGAGVSIATTGGPILKIKNVQYRYVIHVLKIIGGMMIIYGFYELLLKGLYTGVLEFLAVIFGMTGLLILPPAMILWGTTGLLYEYRQIEE